MICRMMHFCVVLVAFVFLMGGESSANAMTAEQFAEARNQADAACGQANSATEILSLALCRLQPERAIVPPQILDLCDAHAKRVWQLYEKSVPDRGGASADAAARRFMNAYQHEQAKFLKAAAARLAQREPGDDRLTDQLIQAMGQLYRQEAEFTHLLRRQEDLEDRLMRTKEQFLEAQSGGPQGGEDEDQSCEARALLFGALAGALHPRGGNGPNTAAAGLEACNGR